MKTTAKNFRLFLLPEVEERIRHFAKLAAGEVSGLGLVEEVNGGFLVTQVFLPRQECTPGGTELDQEWVAALLVTLEEEGLDSGGLKFWWHSHAGMPTFWSQTDEECIAGLANDNFYTSLVTNKAGEMLARLDIFKPVHVTIDCVPVVVRHESRDLLERCRKEFEEKVEEKLTVFGGSNRSSFRSTGFGSEDLFLPHWASEEFEDPGPFAHVEELELRFAEGELTWEEYCERLQSLAGEM